MPERREEVGEEREEEEVSSDPPRDKRADPLAMKRAAEAIGS